MNLFFFQTAHYFFTGPCMMLFMELTLSNNIPTLACTNKIAKKLAYNNDQDYLQRLRDFCDLAYNNGRFSVADRNPE